MKKKTLKALKKSMKHWLDNAAAEKISDVSIEAKDCALCEMFLLPNASCVGCPVEEHTGVWYCERSPFINAAEAYNAWVWAWAESSKPASHAKKTFQAAARKQYEFLESLLPKGESA